ncbi:hypothetical protein LCGC14_0056900 [marine sediment metagenome]|uniref:Zinc resistance-associated protein n=1 Tax=marine sediment metagenome TaxID=412755 RepID=A0A0F9Y595_9ZZZZ|nr:Spy/CpxP family protein refolding chaperone [Halomonas sp.]HDZ47393.1 periplasmic heavy metal sensor [Halomonas sp.]HEB03921.1 periplasmic heavy metal sensor [Halomonas sp.]
MVIRKHTFAFGLTLALAASGTGIAFAQGMMGDQAGQGRSMMGGMMGGGQGGMGPGMMGEMMGGGMMPCPMMGGASMGMMSMFDDDQRSEMRELMQEHRPAQFERMGRMMNLRDDLMAELHGDRPAPDEVQTLHGQMAELHGEMMAEMVRMQNAIHDLMSDEQRQQFEQATPESSIDPEDHDTHH